MKSRCSLGHGTKNFWLVGLPLLVLFHLEAAEKSGHDPKDLRTRVERQIAAEVPEAAESITVQHRDDQIVLAGTVASLALQWRAGEAAQGVRGVQDVVNRIQVRSAGIDDRKIQEDVYWALQADSATKALGIEVEVQNGIVTLRGSVDTVPGKNIAEWVASDRLGVREVVNEIRVAPLRRPDHEILDELRTYYATDPLFNDDEIEVRVQNGSVVLSGHVDTAREKNWARADAWIRGVQQVNAGELGIKPEGFRVRAEPSEKVSDVDIRRAIMQAYVNEPRIDSVNPEVRVENGVVTLDGRVTNLRAKRRAVRIARETGGAREVVDHLQLESAAPRSDAEIAGDILAALGSSVALAQNEINVDATRGRVVLRGKVDSAYEHWLAGELAERATGVVEVENQTRIDGADGLPGPPPYFTRRRIVPPTSTPPRVER